MVSCRFWKPGPVVLHEALMPKVHKTVSFEHALDFVHDGLGISSVPMADGPHAIAKCVHCI